MLSKERLAAIAVGDTLFVAGMGHVSVITVGRKYFHVAPEGKTPNRHNTKTFTIDGGDYFSKDGVGHPLRIYDTEGEYIRERESDHAWKALNRWFVGKYSKPPRLTTETINEILELLKESEDTNG